jgi:hypothetical protein
MSNLEQLYKIAPVYQELFDKQLAFALSPARFVAALCSRRGGKTTVCAAYGIQELMSNPNTIGIYLALTDKSVADIFMPAVRPLIAKYVPKAKVNADEILFPNGSKLIIAGANNVMKIESFRGLKLLFCIIDEAASFREKLLHYLVDEIIVPSLSDLQGKLMMIGTPAAHCMGMFYEVTESSNQAEWDVFRWTAYDNPFMAIQWDLDAELFLRRKKVDRNNPKFRREFLGEWCTDEESLMIRPFTIQAPPTPYHPDSWHTVMGIDFGFNDQTAFSIIGWRKDNPTAYVLETFGQSGLSVSGIANHLTRFKEKYNPRRIVGDPAGASKIIIEEFSDKYHIFINPAQKTNKAHYIEILNDALINSELLLHPTTTDELQKEMKSVVWNDERTTEMEGMKCDHLDATLYAFRESLEYLEKVPRPVVIDDAYREKQFYDQIIRADKEAREAKQGDSFFDDISNFLD